MLVDVATVIASDAAKPKWYDDPANIALLIRWLDCKCLLNSWEPDDYAYLLEKPQKWQPEWEQFQAEFAKAEAGDHA